MSSFWTLTVTDGRDAVTTTHPTLDGAIRCFADNYDPEGEFPKTPSGIRAAADAQGLRIDLSEQDLES